MVWLYRLSVGCWRRAHKSQNLIASILERFPKENLFIEPEKNTCQLKKVCFYTEQELDCSAFVKWFGDKASSSCDKEDVGVFDIADDYSEKDFTLGEQFAGFFLFPENAENDTFRIIKNVYNKTAILYKSEVAVKNVGSILEKVVFSPLKQLSKCLEEKSNKLKRQASETPDDERKTTINEELDDIDDLIGDVIALFNMSNIDEKLHPVFNGYEVEVINDEIAEGLLKFKESVKGFGFRFNTLIIDVKEFKPQDEAKPQKLERDIRNHLEKVGITNIKFNYVSAEDTVFTHVGAKCTADNKTGTLGCFAYATDERGCATLYALITKHLAQASQDRSIYVDSGKLGDVVPSTIRDSGYDIAAVKTLSQVPSSNFKDSGMIYCQGKLHSDVVLERYRQLQNMKVYMWSTASDRQPRFGKITIPRYIVADTSLPRILVTDQSTSERMAETGDSGAIICVDDLDDEHIRLISMLEGSNESDQTFRENPGRKRSYLTFSLKKGLDQLSERTGSIFKLKSDLCISKICTVR